MLAPRQPPGGFQPLVQRLGTLPAILHENLRPAGMGLGRDVPLVERLANLLAALRRLRQLGGPLGGRRAAFR